ncbi:MAG: dihydrofolate reductase family protein [Tropheryma whipplei]|uniref:dihydrofolate reductase family protein n=1 Tax=Tropheryma whipplei TaxID=2039 RepID=UPI000000C83A|nr:dihydrofolate reductase family protein [Tropheryma whipplei]MCO8182347.1 dihydrofolate reductase family protein [Tropheryma whipplei]CAD67049.1 conserved hypothetical protein [Tropheryma whipplei TW08/27]
MSKAIQDFISEKYKFPKDDWICANYIQSFSGNLNSDNCTSDTLSNPRDRMILHTIREANDAVFVGARTARVENISVKNKPLIVLTNSGNLGGISANRNTIVIAPKTTETQIRHTIGASVNVIWLDNFGDITRYSQTMGVLIAKAVKSLGFKRIVCEGGLTLIRMLLSAGAIDELCISIVDKNSTGPRIDTDTLCTPKLTQVLVDQEFYKKQRIKSVYTRWVLQNRRGRDEE